LTQIARRHSHASARRRLDAGPLRSEKGGKVTLGDRTLRAQHLPRLRHRRDKFRAAKTPIMKYSVAFLNEAAMRRTLTILFFLSAQSSTALAADPAAGERVFRKCLPCHSIGEGAQHKVGPILNGLIGRPAGGYPGYSYTEANKKSKFVWDEATLAKYLKNPRAAIPGTKMIFAGLPSDNEIADLTAYLKQFGADGKKQ
jgi:cytochrome c